MMREQGFDITTAANVSGALKHWLLLEVDGGDTSRALIEVEGKL
jgi:hypothetical protein